MRDISKGGLFVETEDPPPLRSAVEVELTTPDGAVHLKAEVVHIMDPATAAPLGLQAGVGLQFKTLSAKAKTQITQYLEGLAARLTDDLEQHASAQKDAQEVIKTMQGFLQAFSKEDLYEALQVSPYANEAEIKSRIARLRHLFDPATLPAGIRPTQAARIAHAESLLARIESLLTQPERRMDYNLRAGYAEPDEARVRKLDPETLKMLRLHWFDRHPEHRERAQRLLKRAVEAEGRMAYEEAIEAGEEAARLDPFDLSTYDALAIWRKRVNLLSEAWKQKAPEHKSKATQDVEDLLKRLSD